MMGSAVFVVGLMLVLYLMSKYLPGACVQCGKHIRHADNCPSQKGRR